MGIYGIGARLILIKESIINIGPTDLKEVVAPHIDALVVQATIANYVTRVFIDSGSSINILFMDAFNHMHR